MREGTCMGAVNVSDAEEGSGGGEDATAFGAQEFAADEELAGLEDREARW
jgi:hypothetical protein